MDKLRVPDIDGLFDPRDGIHTEAAKLYLTITKELQGKDVNVVLTALSASLATVLFSISDDLEHSLGKLEVGIDVIVENLTTLHDGTVVTKLH